MKVISDQMSQKERREIDNFLAAVTASHAGELRNDHLTAAQSKLINNDKNAADIELITEKSAENVSNFMARVFGVNPFITQ